MKKFTFVIIDDDQKNSLKTKAIASSFQNLVFLASVTNYEDGLNCVLEYNPDIIFLEIDPADKDSNLSLSLINELHRYLKVVPKIFVTTKNDSLCLNAIKFGVFDYLINPIEVNELRKSLYRFEKECETTSIGTNNNNEPTRIVLDSKIDDLKKPNDLDFNDLDSQTQSITKLSKIDDLIDSEYPIASSPSLDDEKYVMQTTAELNQPIIENNTLNRDLPLLDDEVSFIQTGNNEIKPLVVCVKSYGDYRYIEAKDICYMQADNNSTDIHLQTGEMITAFKTLKHFEGVMVYPFVRIHNSYIVNVNYVSRIHTGNAVCHIKGTTTKLPFSKSYKENIDAIIATIAAGNYLEI